MAVSDIEKAKQFLRGAARGDPDLVTQQVDPDTYVDHDPNRVTNALGLWKHVDSMAKNSVAYQLLRILHDGPFVVIQHRGSVPGRRIVFEVFRFDAGLIVEHWCFSSTDGPPNKSGHTQFDGPTEPEDASRTEANKSTVEDYYDTVHVKGRHCEARRWFQGNLMIRHEPGVADGVDEFLRDLSILARDRTIDEIKILVSQGDFVFVVARGTFRGEPCAYVELYRVEAAKIVEHWGFPVSVPAHSTLKSRFGLL